MAYAPARTSWLPLAWLVALAPWGAMQARAEASKSPSQMSIGLLSVGPCAAYTEAGLARLSWELGQRTSVKVALAATPVAPTTEALMKAPVLVWRGATDPGPLTQSSIVALRHYLLEGGSLLIDAHDSDTGGPFAAAARRELERIFADSQAQPLPAEHVVFKSFYLVGNDAGRHQAGGPALGVMIHHRLAVLLLRNDLLGAFSPRPDGGWALAVGDGDNQRREMALRMAINWLMYALCLDYKEDQVHLPFILRRRP